MSLTSGATAPHGGRLELRNVHVAFPLENCTVHAVRGVSLTVDRGETVGIVGESGSGKSALVSAVLGVLPPPGQVTAGSVHIGEVDLTSLDGRRAGKVRGTAAGMVFQDPDSALNPVMKVGEHIAEVLRHKRNMTRGAAQARAIQLLNDVGIRDPERRYHDYPHQFSGGMQQRALVAAALANEPWFLIADEPTTALDPTTERGLLLLLKRMQHQWGLGMVFVTHDLRVAAAICDRLVVMYAGRVVEEGPTRKVLDEPLHPYTHALRNSVAVMAKARKEKLAVIPGQPPEMIEIELGCSFRDRCPHARDVCATNGLALTPHGKRRVRCYGMQEGGWLRG